MFELTAEEYESLRSQIGTLKRGEHAKYAPFAFTEQDVAMLSSVLSSPQAISVNIQIMRIFTRMRELMLTHKDIIIKLDRIEKSILGQEDKNKKYEEDIQLIFKALKQLLQTPVRDAHRKKIGYKRDNEKEE